nr:hypothetical protein [Tanacetum cinerariifolium]
MSLASILVRIGVDGLSRVDRLRGIQSLITVDFHGALDSPSSIAGLGDLGALVVLCVPWGIQSCSDSLYIVDKAVYHNQCCWMFKLSQEGYLWVSMACLVEVTRPGPLFPLRSNLEVLQIGKRKGDGNNDVHPEGVVSKKRVGEAGAPRKKRKTHIGTPLIDADSKQVSSLAPINHSLPVVALANEGHVSETDYAARLATLRNQTDEQGSPLDLANKNVEEPVVGEKRDSDHNNLNVIIEGRGDPADGLSGLRSQPSPNNCFGLRIESVKKPTRDKTLLDAEASYSAGRFGNLPFTPQRGLTDSIRMMKSRKC